MKLSDGIATVTTLVNAKAFEGVKDLKYSQNSVISIKGFKINKLKGKNVLILEQPFKLLGHCSPLGDPKSYETLQKSDFTKHFNL